MLLKWFDRAGRYHTAYSLSLNVLPTTIHYLPTNLPTVTSTTHPPLCLLHAHGPTTPPAAHLPPYLLYLPTAYLLHKNGREYYPGTPPALLGPLPGFGHLSLNTLTPSRPPCCPPRQMPRWYRLWYIGTRHCRCLCLGEYHALSVNRLPQGRSRAGTDFSMVHYTCVSAIEVLVIDWK